jgi:hypothetical protein
MKSIRNEQSIPPEEYRQAIALSESIAAEVGMPAFYTKRADDVARSFRLLASEKMVKDCIRIIRKRGDMIGHGAVHVQKVAIDAGAIVLIEGEAAGDQDNLKRRVLLAHIAAILHDIRRSEKHHARLGATEAAELLKPFSLTAGESRAICAAIANHEAFQPSQALDEPDDQLLSDALYDADKFRWGPDNFTETLWAMVIPRKVPLDALLNRFLRGLDGVNRIRDTFRTETGRLYGPDFIDRGMEIGRKLYAALTEQRREDS